MKAFTLDNRHRDGGCDDHGSPCRSRHTHFVRGFGVSVLAAITFGLFAAGIGGAADGGPLLIGGLNLGTAGGNITQLRAIDNGPAFYATNEWGNGISAIAYPPYAIGVYGIHQATSGSAPGVRGDSYSTDASNGVEGYAVANGGSGVYGANTGAAFGYGVTGSGSDRGVYGVGGDFGVYGLSTNLGGVGVSGLASVGTTPVGVLGATGSTQAGAVGVWGTATAPARAGVFIGDVQITGNLNVTGTLTKGSGAFRIDHPLHPATQYLQHSFVESPDMKDVYDGNVVTDANGLATVGLPDWFQALNRDFRYQLTIVGHSPWGTEARVWEEIKNNHFSIRTNGPGVKVSWQVTGIRHDRYANAHRIQVVVPKTGADVGKYVSPELYGREKAAGIGYRTLPKPHRRTALGTR